VNPLTVNMIQDTDSTIVTIQSDQTWGTYGCMMDEDAPCCSR